MNDEKQFQNLLQHFLDSPFLLPKERAGLLFARKLTLEVHAVRREDYQALVQAGYTDPEVLDLVQLISYFNFVNRMAEGLGVHLEGPDFF